MPSPDFVFSRILWSPVRLLAVILILVFSTEVAVMLLLPDLIPGGYSETAEALVDAMLLTLVCAPILWFVILGAKRAELQRVVMVRGREALRTQQMATLAQLATGVAHEIRNPLTSIKLLIQVNRSRFADEGLPTDDLELVEHEIRRMERSVNSLLDYGRPERTEFTTISLQTVIRNVCSLISGRCATQGVELDILVPEQSVTSMGDASQLQQLLLNLMLNALDAMPEGGALTVQLIGRPEGCEIRVQDTGTGISMKMEDKLFQPFVTTKESGVGLGLGICRRIAQSHDGSLVGFNRPTGGAEFRLTLPKTQPSLHDRRDSAPIGAPTATGQEAACEPC